MTKLFFKYLSNILSIYLLSLVIETIRITNTAALLFMGFVLLFVNLLLRPFLFLFTFPINLLTFGLFSFVVNAWTIMIADDLVPGIYMGGFYNSLLAAFIIVILNHLMIDMTKK